MSSRQQFLAERMIALSVRLLNQFEAGPSREARPARAGRGLEGSHAA
jgi:hypothetical protein